jgi:uncharacterized YigZ family protein
MKRLEETTTVHYEIKKSKFIGFLIPIKTEEEAKIAIQQIKDDHPKATHHCVAYQIKSDNIIRFDDDGEPQHTAGKPMLSVLLAQDLNQVLAVVVRYYGGIKLGPGGLIKAYTLGVTSAIASATFITLVEVFDLSFDCPFEYAAQVESYAHHIEATVDTNYNQQDSHFLLTLKSLDGVIEVLNSLSKGTITNINHSSRFE